MLQQGNCSISKDTAFALLGSDEVSRQLAEIGKKVDLILQEAQSSSMQLIRDAFIAYEHKNYQDACQVGVGHSS